MRRDRRYLGVARCAAAYPGVPAEPPARGRERASGALTKSGARRRPRIKGRLEVLCSDLHRPLGREDRWRKPSGLNANVEQWETPRRSFRSSIYPLVLRRPEGTSKGAPVAPSRAGLGLIASRLASLLRMRFAMRCLPHIALRSIALLPARPRTIARPWFRPTGSRTRPRSSPTPTPASTISPGAPSSRSIGPR